MNKHRAGKITRALLTKLVMIIMFVIVVFPFFWLVISSFKLEKDIISYPPTIFPPDMNFTTLQWQLLFERVPMWVFTRNTVIFAVSVMIIATFFESMAGYAFARLNFKGGQAIFNTLIVCMMIPGVISMIPLYMEVYYMGLYDTFAGLILPRMSAIFGIYLMRSFFVSLPKDLEEAARIDGMNEFGIYLKIMLPLCKPALITLGIFTLMFNWNDLLYPLMMTGRTEMRTIPVGLAMFVGQRTADYGPTMAGTTFSCVPLFVLYMFAQKYFQQGVAMSGMKE